MTVLGGDTETLLTGLSSFWQNLFSGKDQLNALYEGTEELLGQVYLDLLTEVLNVNVAEAPLLNKENWHLLAIKSSQVKQDDRYDFPFYTELEEPLVEAEFLFNRVYNPTWSWEVGKDFEIDQGVMRFKVNPFEAEIPGVASKFTRTDPTVLRKGFDGYVDPAEPNILRVRGTRLRGVSGQTFSNQFFRSSEAEFLPEHRGLFLATNTSSGLVSTTITDVIDRHTLQVDALFTSTEDSLVWEIQDASVVSYNNIGDVLLVDVATDTPADNNVYTVVDVPDPFSLVLDKPFPDTFHGVRDIPWQLQNPEYVREMVFWVPNAYLDLENLYYSFGYLIQRRQPSTEGYRALIKGIFQFFMLGPALRRLEAALNVMVGLPVVREDGEVVVSILDGEVHTDRQVYVLPPGSVRTDLQEGDVLNAFDSLTEIFTVTDSMEGIGWAYGREIPSELLRSSAEVDRIIDPRLHENYVGYGKEWKIGDPSTFIDADFDGQSIPEKEGRDLFFVEESGSVFSVGYKFEPEYVGSEIEIEGRTFLIKDVGGWFSNAELTGSPEDFQDLKNNSLSFENFPPLNPDVVVLKGDRVVQEGSRGVYFFPHGNFDARSCIGRAFHSLDFPSVFWKIEDVFDNRTVLLSPVEDWVGSSVPAPETLELTPGLSWKIPLRPGLRHNVGYNLMFDVVKRQVCYISYDLSRWDVPFLRSGQDIQDVILAGKPGHIYVMFSPENFTTSHAGISQKEFSTALLPITDLKEVVGVLTIGDHWSVGSVYSYTYPKVSWIRTIRAYEFGNEIVLPTVEGEVEWIFMAEDGTGGVEVEILVPTSDGGTATFTSLRLGEDVGAEVETVSFDKNFHIRLEEVPGLDRLPVRVGVKTQTPSVLIADGVQETGVEGVVVGGNLQIPGYTFSTPDQDREVLLNIEGQEFSLWVDEVVDEDTVSLKQPVDGKPFLLPFADNTFVDCDLVVSKWYATPVVINGSNPLNDRGNIASWPVQVLHRG